MWIKSVTPSFGDIDGLRHVNNCKLPEWFELAREPVFRLFHPDLSYPDWQLIMARISVDFVSQMRIGYDIEIRTFIRKVGRSSMTVYQEAWQNDQLGAKGDAVIVHYDFVNQKSLSIPDHIRDVFAQHMVPEDNAAVKAKSGRFPGARTK